MPEELTEVNLMEMSAFKPVPKVLSRTKYQGSFDVDQKSYGPNVL